MISVAYQDQRRLKDMYKGKALNLNQQFQMSVLNGRYSMTTNILQKSSNVAKYDITQRTNICQWDIYFDEYEMTENSRQMHTLDKQTQNQINITQQTKHNHSKSTK